MQHAAACEESRTLRVRKKPKPDHRRSRAAKRGRGAVNEAGILRRGPEAPVRRAAYQRLRDLRGAEPAARGVPRRRGRPTRSKATRVRASAR